mgnify:CR=1 FL=1
MNLKELSDILGISQTTISRALNGYPEVNKDTKKRVVEAAKKYGYTPSSVARRLAGKKVEAVGVKASNRMSYLGMEVANKFPLTEYTLPRLAGITTSFTTRSVANARYLSPCTN